jgi:hypothetical protein
VTIRESKALLPRSMTTAEETENPPEFFYEIGFSPVSVS